MKTAIIIPTSLKPSLVKLLRSLSGQPYDQLILEMGGNGPAEARNRGFAQIKKSMDLIGFIDDDVIVNEDYIVQAKWAFFKSGADYGQSKVIGEQENSKDKFISTAIWFKKEAFEQLGGFDCKFLFSNEDIDIYLRAKAKGLKCIYIPGSVAWHPKKGMYEKLVYGNKLLKSKHPKYYEILRKELR